jgi:hypothetical protein
MTSTALKTAIVILAVRGCKTCAGFGHGDTKCLTSVKLKFFGRKIKIIRQLLKTAAATVTPKGTVTEAAVWPL